MKHLILITFAIILYGHATPDMWLIAKKYDRNYNTDIPVVLVDKITSCGKDHDIFWGCMHYYNNGYKWIEISQSAPFEYILLHEIGHYYFGISETKANEYANLIHKLN